VSATLKFSLRGLPARLRGFLNKQKNADEFNDEVQQHLQMLTEGFVAQGMSWEDAAKAARLQFGNLTSLKEDRWELQTLTSIEALWLDLRYAMRALWTSRAFVAVSIATLAVGIGAATAIFSVIDNVLLEPFPYKDWGRMVFSRIHDTTRSEEAGRQGCSSDEFLEFARQNQVFDAVIATSDDPVLTNTGKASTGHTVPG
jgi:hypothetical protein